MVASSLREGREDHTFRRKSEVRYHSGTKGSEEKIVHSDKVKSSVLFCSQELLFVQQG